MVFELLFSQGNEFDDVLTFYGFDLQLIKALVAEELEFELGEDSSDFFLDRNQSSQVFVQAGYFVEKNLTFLENSFEEIAPSHLDHFFPGEFFETLALNGVCAGQETQ